MRAKKPHTTKRWILKIGFLAILLILSGFLLCQNEPKSDIALVQDKDYIVQVLDQKVDQPEVMIYVYQVRDQFQKVGGEDVWSIEDFSDGKSASQVAKESVLNNIVRSKILDEKGQELEFSLQEDEENEVGEYAKNYFDKMDSRYRNKYAITEPLVEKVFAEATMGNKVMDYVTQDISPSEDTIQSFMDKDQDYQKLSQTSPEKLLTMIYATKLVLRDSNESQETSSDSEENLTTDGTGQVGDSSQDSTTDEEDMDQLTKMQTIRQLAIQGKTFQELATSYGLDTPIEVSYSQEQVPPIFSSLLNLGEGDISPVIEADEGYILFKVNSITKPSQDTIQDFNDRLSALEERLHQKAIDEIKRQAFNELYEEWKKSTSFSVNSESWNQIQVTPSEDSLE